MYAEADKERIDRAVAQAGECRFHVRSAGQHNAILGDEPGQGLRRDVVPGHEQVTRQRVADKGEAKATTGAHGEGQKR